MSVSHYQSLPNSRLILSWVGAIGVLWLLLLWKGIGFSAQGFYAHPQSQPLSSSDTYAHHAATEHQLSPRRPANSVASTPVADPVVPVVGALFFTALVVFALLKTRINQWLILSPVAHQLQLATLNISRAPPSLR